MFKKILAVQIIAALILTSATACSGNITVVDSGDGSSQSDSSAQNEESTSDGDSSSESGNSSDSNSSDGNSSSGNSSGDSVQAVQTADDMFTERDLSGEYSDYSEVTLSGSTASSSAAGVTIDGSTVTITKEGTYMLSGTLDDGQIIVSCADTDKVQLVLNNASITKNGSAAIYITEADKVFITSASGTVNTLSSTGEFAQTDDNNIDGAVFSKADIIFNGSGTLNVSCETAHGLVTKDDLKITGGTYSIASAKSGISGKDSVRIAGGSITVNSGTDGIHSENTEDVEKGYVYISGGTLDLTSGNDGIDASGNITIKDGTFGIVSGDGASAANNYQASAESDSFKGIKSDTLLDISGGTFTIDSRDDALHTNGDAAISGGTFTISTGDDGVHADNTTTISNGEILISKCYEGIEGANIVISGGKIELTSSDDGINAAGGNDSSGFGGGMWGDKFGGGGGMEGSSDYSIAISGGELTVHAEGDGIDSNGSIDISGGTVYVFGPTNSGNGSLDCGTSATISGGIFMAAGSSGMAVNFSSESAQCAIMCNLSSQQAGTEFKLTDADGNVVASCTPDKNYQTVMISTPDIEVGQTYTVSAGSESQTVEMTSTVYGSGGMGGFGGGHGGGMKPGREMDNGFVM